MNFTRRIPKPPKRSSRWRSLSHRNFVRGRACSMCHGTTSIEVAHVRLGSGAGIGQKPDDWRIVLLCQPCHQEQHTIGKRSFWELLDIESIINHFCETSPKADEIRALRNG